MEMKTLLASPIPGLAIMVGGLLVYILILRRDRGSQRGGAPARRAYSRAEALLSRRAKSRQKQVRDALGPFLAHVGILAQPGVTLREALWQAVEASPPSPLTECVQNALNVGAVGERFFDELLTGAQDLGYYPFVLTVIKWRLLSGWSGEISRATLDSARFADEMRWYFLRLAAGTVQIRMSGLIVLTLLPAVWLTVIMPMMMAAARSLGGVP